MKHIAVLLVWSDDFQDYKARKWAVKDASLITDALIRPG